MPPTIAKNNLNSSLLEIQRSKNERSFRFEKKTLAETRSRPRRAFVFKIIWNWNARFARALAIRIARYTDSLAAIFSSWREKGGLMGVKKKMNCDALG